MEKTAPGYVFFFGGGWGGVGRVKWVTNLKETKEVKCKAIIIMYKTECNKQTLLRHPIYSSFVQIYHLKLSIVLFIKVYVQRRCNRIDVDSTS